MTPLYKTPLAFKQALEQRLRTDSKSGIDFARSRQLLVFERFLARVTHEFGDRVTLKGGLAVELRIDRARTTKDVDLRVLAAPDGILERLRAASRVDTGDFMDFVVRPDARHPAIQNEGLRYEGMRFRAECSLGGKVYGRPFWVDIVFGDPMIAEPDLMVAPDSLGFAGIAPPTLRVYPVETHIAEKLHAYTMPRTRPNSRVKDLPDLALLPMAGAIEGRRLRAAIDQTFGFRATHDVPERLPEPLDSWAAPFAAIAREDHLPWATLADVFDAVRTFLDPILSGADDREWNPQSWTWSSSTS